MVEPVAGMQAAPFTMNVELGKIREFARATHSRNPDYAGWEDRPAITPGTFLRAAVFWQPREAQVLAGVDRNLARLVHGEQEFRFFGTPPKAGDVLTGTERIDKVYEREGSRGGSMSFTEVVTEFRGPAGELIAEVRSTTIETSKPAGGGK